MSEGPLIVGLGEAMLRLGAPNQVPLLDAGTLEVHVGGTELNVLIAASALGARARWLTRLPRSSLGEIIRRHALSRGVTVVSHDELGARAGLFFLESGVPPRPSRVLYDRLDSAASHVGADEFDWADELNGASAAHVTGITCALGDGPAAAALALLTAARGAGVMTSFDVNYRSQLWDIPAALASFQTVLPLVDTLFASPDDLTMLRGRVDDPATLVEEISQEFGTSTVVLRESRQVSPLERTVEVRVFGDASGSAQASGTVVDELGAGDAAAAAFLVSMASGESGDLAARRCARAYARMLTIPGDSWTGGLFDLDDGYTTASHVQR
ncbi:MAG: PfkB family carbohydrate kinase [Acidimicrobiales bacterium]